MLWEYSTQLVTSPPGVHVLRRINYLNNLGRGTPKDYLCQITFKSGQQFLKQIVGKPNFSDQFKKIVKCYIRVGYNLGIM